MDQQSIITTITSNTHFNFYSISLYKNSIIIFDSEQNFFLSFGIIWKPLCWLVVLENWFINHSRLLVFFPIFGIKTLLCFFFLFFFIQSKIDDFNSSIFSFFVVFFYHIKKHGYLDFLTRKIYIFTHIDILYLYIYKYCSFFTIYFNNFLNWKIKVKWSTNFFAKLFYLFISFNSIIN